MFRPTVLSEAQLGAVKLFGSRRVMRDGVRLTEPAYGTHAVRALLRVGYVQDEAALMRVLSDAGVSGPGVKLFTASKTVTRLSDEHGGGIDVIPRIPGITDHPLSDYAESDAGADSPRVVVTGEVPVVDDRVLTYKLNAIFTDTTVSDKLQLSPRRLQVSRRLAVSDPAAAAAGLGDYIRSNGFPNARVVAGDYAKTVGRAREFIRQFADTIRYRDTAAPAIVTNSDLRMTYDAFEEADPKWTVIGPLKFSTEVQAIYQLAIHYGPERVMFMLGVETVTLRINIYNEKNREYYTGVMYGYSSLAGIRPVDSSLPAELTADQQSRLVSASRKVSPVYVDDAVVGSAVHVSDRHLILNEHTLVEAVDAERVPVLCGQPLYESRSVAHDITMVKREGIEAQWVFRESTVGERVVLCFSVGDTVEYSEVLRVLSVHGEQLILSDSNVLRKGASGAAVIALRDSALLGIFSTKRGAHVVCAAFSSAAFSIVTDYQSVTSSEYPVTPSVGAGNRTYDRMVRKGLLSFLEEISNSSASLYIKRASGVKEFAGLVANVAGEWTTTVDPDFSQLMLQDGVNLSFRTGAKGAYSVTSPPPILRTLPNVRYVNPGERVFLFTKVGDDVVMSSVRVVTHCMADMREFIVEDFGDTEELMTGGLIVAEKDAAVVGQLLRKDMDAYGSTTMRCLSLDLNVPVTVSVAAVKPDARAVVSEMKEWVSSSEVSMRELSQFGKTVVDVVAGQRAYHRGMAISDGISVIGAEWTIRRAKVMESFGWATDDYLNFVKYDRDVVAAAFLALVYFRDPVGTSSKLGTLLTNDTIVESTPVTGEFPFLRPLSATGSVSSNVTTVDQADSESRLRELETRFHDLTQMLRERPEPG